MGFSLMACSCGAPYFKRIHSFFYCAIRPPAAQAWAGRRAPRSERPSFEGGELQHDQGIGAMWLPAFQAIGGLRLGVAATAVAAMSELRLRSRRGKAGGRL